MSWLSRLFGGEDKDVATESSLESADKDESYALAWRNRYLAARIAHLDKQAKKKNIGGVIAFALPDDVQSGSLDDLKILNQKLEKQVEYLEELLKTH